MGKHLSGLALALAVIAGAVTVVMTRAVTEALIICYAAAGLAIVALSAGIVIRLRGGQPYRPPASPGPIAATARVVREIPVSDIRVLPPVSRGISGALADNRETSGRWAR